MTQDEVISHIDRLTLQPQDILVLRTTNEANPYALAHLVERLTQRGLNNLVFVIADDSDICLFDQERMARWGWVRDTGTPARPANPPDSPDAGWDTEYLGAGS